MILHYNISQSVQITKIAYVIQRILTCFFLKYFLTSALYIYVMRMHRRSRIYFWKRHVLYKGILIEYLIVILELGRMLFTKLWESFRVNLQSFRVK